MILSQGSFNANMIRLHRLEPITIPNDIAYHAEDVQDAQDTAVQNEYAGSSQISTAYAGQANEGAVDNGAGESQNLWSSTT